ncbi:hypothetical protein [Leptospira yasudae]|uniref:Uncharacterized protein n=1 Tax=Leptospira yasudae TaxID=2202201 RepID=A0ABX9LYC6_9LEPT|nr:hypothetical protein [Leptospira yasudae]RHX77559.1 hypothetical protein DLM77_20860 [Leptospira yasudae]
MSIMGYFKIIRYTIFFFKKNIISLLYVEVLINGPLLIVSIIKAGLGRNWSWGPLREYLFLAGMASSPFFDMFADALIFCNFAIVAVCFFIKRKQFQSKLPSFGSIFNTIREHVSLKKALPLVFLGIVIHWSSRGSNFFVFVVMFVVEAVFLLILFLSIMDDLDLTSSILRSLEIMQKYWASILINFLLFTSLYYGYILTTTFVIVGLAGFLASSRLIFVTWLILFLSLSILKLIYFLGILIILIPVFIYYKFLHRLTHK